MTFDVEVVLKGRDFATTEAVSIEQDDPSVCTDDAVREVLAAILRAIERGELDTLVTRVTRGDRITVH